MCPFLPETVVVGSVWTVCVFASSPQDHPSYDESRCSAFHADVTKSLSDNIPDSSVDMATMIFVLSAIHPDKMVLALRNVLQVCGVLGIVCSSDGLLKMQHVLAPLTHS